jgi:hypothetical protein
MGGRSNRSGMGCPMRHPVHGADGRPRSSFAAIRSLRVREGHAVIRIEIGAMPPLLRSIVSSALETEGDMAVMAASEHGRSGADLGADVLIVCSDREPDDRIAVRQLASADSPAIVAIDSEVARATILRVTAESTAIGAASDLRDAVRLAAGYRQRTTN